VEIFQLTAMNNYLGILVLGLALAGAHAAEVRHVSVDECFDK
jgi:hypothetical protein